MKHEGVGGKYLNTILREIGKGNASEHLGVIDAESPAYRKLLKKHGINPDAPQYDENGKPSYLSFKDAVQIAREAQPWPDSANPEKDFLRDLRLAVADELGIVKEEELDGLRAYTAVGSPLEHMHGINFFIEYIKTGERTPLRAFGDVVTENFEKKRKKSGAIYVNARMIDNQENDQGNYLDKVAEIARRVADALREKERALDAADRN